MWWPLLPVGIVSWRVWKVITGNTLISWLFPICNAQTG